MSFLLRPFVVLALLVSVASAQPDPGAGEVKALKTQFQAEREQAVKARFPADVLAKADDLVARAEAAAKDENFKAAVRLLRDARWQLPYLPPGLPDHVTRVLGEARMRHSIYAPLPDGKYDARVNALSYSPDGKTLATASRDGTAKVWDLSNGREVSTYRAHVTQPDDPTRGATNVLWVADVAFHPKESVVATACGNQVHLWNPQTGKAVKTLLTLGKTEKPLKALAFSPDGKRLAVGSDDGVLRVIDADTGKAVYTSPSRNARIERVAFSPNGKLVAVGDMNSQIAVYAPAGANTPLMSVQGIDAGAVTGVAFAADSAAVFAAGGDGKARLTAGPNPAGGAAANTATKLRDFVGHAGPVGGLAVTADGKYLVTGGDDKTVRVWDANTGKQLRSFQGHTDKVTAVTVRPDGKQIASASADGAVRVWDLNTTDDHKAATDAKQSLWAVAVSPDGKTVATAGADKSIRLYDADTAKLRATLDAGTAVTALAFLPDGKLAAGGGSRTAAVYDLAAKKAVAELTGHGLAVLAVAAGDDGKLVVTGSADAAVRGFAPDGKERWTWPSRKAACAVAVRKGGKHVAVGLADGMLATLDVSGGAPKELSALSAHTAGVAGVSFSPDGTKLATVGGDGALKVWSLTDAGALGPTPLAKFDGPSGPTASPLSTVAFGPDGRFVAAAGADGVVRVWDVQLKAEVRGLRAHTDWVTCVAFAPDGRFVASVAAEKDNSLRVFEMPALESAGAAGGHMLAVNAVAVSPDGKLAATAATDQTIKIWDIATGKEVSTLIGNADTPFAIAFLGNASVVMGGRVPVGGSGRLHLWGTTPPRLNNSVATSEVYTLVASADGTKFGAWAVRPTTGEVMDNTYEVYDAKGAPLTPKPLTDKGRNVRSATFTPDLAWAVAGDAGGTLRVWDMEKMERIGGDWPLFQKSFADLGVTADKKLLVAADEGGLVKVADIAKREVLVSGQAHKTGGVRSVLVSPTGKTFVTISNDREVKAWSLADPKELKELRAWSFAVTINGAAYTPDGKSVVTANADGTAYVLELP
jgi:WD40 repeat protein